MLNFMKMIFVVTAASFCGASGFAKDCGKISSLKGNAEVLRVKEGSADTRVAVKAKRRMKLDCTDIFVTHAATRAKLRLEDAVLTVGPNSRIIIDDPSQKDDEAQTMNLAYGKVRTLFKGKQPKEGSRFKVKTPAAVVGVRGTDFWVAYKPNEKVTEQATLTGLVEVQQNETSKKTLVEPGTQVAVENINAKVIEEVREQSKELEDKKKADIAALEKKSLSEEEKAKAIAELNAKLAAEKAAKEAAIKAAIVKVAEAKDLKKEVLSQEVVAEIKSVSAIVKDDADFTSEGAVKYLGSPDTWKEIDIPSKYEPFKTSFKKLKNSSSPP